MTRAELVEHLAQLVYDEMQRITRIVNWRSPGDPQPLWDGLPEESRDLRRRAMTSVLDELDRLDLLAP